MMNSSTFQVSWLCAIVLGISSLTPLPPASAQEATPSETAEIDPTAIDLMRKSARFLAERPTLSFNWFVSYDEVFDETQKLTFMRSGTNILARDKGFFSRVEGESGVREYFYDGAKFTVSAPDENFYADESFDKGFEALVDAVRDATDTDIPLHAIMGRDLPDRVEGDLKSAVYLGITFISGSEVHHLAFSDEEEDWQVWISTDEEAPLPLVIVGTETKKTGWPQYRAYLTDWDVSSEVAQERFAFKPDDDDLKITLPEFKSKNATDAKAEEAERATSKAAEPAATDAAPPAEPTPASEK